MTHLSTLLIKQEICLSLHAPFRNGRACSGSLSQSIGRIECTKGRNE